MLHVVSYVGHLDIKKWQIYQKIDALKAPPFTHCRVDIFGTFVIQERTSDLKQYWSLLTCFAHRAVHIEDVNAMDTDSFIQTQRRFIARRRTI